MHRRPALTRAFTLLAALVVTLAASACSDTNLDKAGGTRSERPVVLTLANHEVGPQDVQFWIDEVQRRSGGSLRIQVMNRWRNGEFAYDKATIADIQAGKVQLAKVNARVYDTLGVESFQALVAPFLIDNHTLQRRVLESNLIGEMLAGIGKLGLVGLTVLPTRLRKPLGVSRPLVTVEDYQGARIGTREGEVAEATFAALGAIPVGTIPGVRRDDLNGIELDFGLNEYEKQAKAFTSNVTLWPRPVTLLASRNAFESLTPTQQDALRQAGSAVLSRQLKDQQGLSASDGRILCRRGVRFARASDQDLAALRRAVQPVYDKLEGNAETKSFLQRILAMKQETRAASTPDSRRDLRRSMEPLPGRAHLRASRRAPDALCPQTVASGRLSGISATRRVPPPGRLSTRSRPCNASTRSARPRRPEPAGSAPPPPSSLTSRTTRPARRSTRTPTLDALACLATLASASEQTK
jgi:TRAP-type C4-dicarboxylate transport system substrate-binding protein